MCQHVVGTIVPQYEIEELITEGLSINQKWNPAWLETLGFLMDNSLAELGAIVATHSLFHCFVFSSCSAGRWEVGEEVH